MKATTQTLSRISDTACTRCGCVCDDITLEVQAGRITEAEKACPMGRNWFLLSQSYDAGSVAFMAGQPASLGEAYRRAAEILYQAKAPLIYGLSESTTEGQRSAVALAEACGGIIDTTATLEHAQSLMALQQVGESTCTLGEVKARADLIIYWGSNPVQTHPRHLERYTVDAPGRFVEHRQMVVVDVRRTETAERADTFITIEPEQDAEALAYLRLRVQGLETGPGTLQPETAKQLDTLAREMVACRFGILFFGRGLTRKVTGHRAVEALLRLVTDLNRFTRFYARRMRVLGDVAGADSVLTWQTGFPFAVNLQRGFPRYNPGEWSATDLLRRGEVDALVVLGADTLQEFPADARARLAQLPMIVLDGPGKTPIFLPTVQFITTVYGIHRHGTAYRMDEVPIPLRQILPSPLPGDQEVLDGILSAYQQQAQV